MPGNSPHHTTHLGGPCDDHASQPTADRMDKHAPFQQLVSTATPNETMKSHILIFNVWRTLLVSFYTHVYQVGLFCFMT